MNRSYHTPAQIREIMTELTGKEVDETFSMSRHFIQTAVKISHLVNEYLSIVGAVFRIREVLPLMMELCLAIM